MGERMMAKQTSRAETEVVNSENCMKCCESFWGEMAPILNILCCNNGIWSRGETPHGSCVSCLRRWPAMCIHGDKSQPERDWVLSGIDLKEFSAFVLLSEKNNIASIH